MRHFLKVFGLCLAVLAITPVAAQDLATLVADRVAISGGNTLVAQGAVEVFYKGRRLKAQRISYDQSTEILTIEGPIALTDDQGTVILADQAELSADLTEGVLTSARLVLNQQLQLAANEMMRIGGRYTSLGQTVVSSCKICANNPTPLWEIRAKRVIHDEVERQIYFESAQMRVAGIPIFWVPQLRMPDPTLDRATGFLAPTVRTTSDLGFGVKVPYFIRLGDSRDLTITPYVASKNVRSVDLRYRQAFTSGRIEVSGALGRDEALPGEWRGYMSADGVFTLPRDFTLQFSGKMVTDKAYLVDYGLSSDDRLDSRIEATRTRRNEYISARLINFRSLRDDDVPSTLPSIITDMTWQRRFSPDLIGGEGGLRLQTHSHYRSSDSGADSDSDGISDGRDMSRISVTADWRRNWILPGGVLAAVLTEVNGDFYSVGQDDVYGGEFTRAHGGVAVEFRWPWTRSAQNGVSHVIEPIVQLIWSPKTASDVPVEDSVLTEFDAGNLFSLNRFPGADEVEQGPRANVGVTYTRFDPAGWSLGMTVGRVLRSEDFGQFSTASGLAGKKSDWLAAMQLATSEGLTMTNRLVFDDDLDVTKAELRFDLQQETFGLGSSYVWMLADETESRNARVSELTIDGRYEFSPSWTANLSTRYDFEADRAASAGLNLIFANECLKVDMTIQRRFTSSTAVDPTTAFGLSFDLIGFGQKGKAGPAQACSG